MSKPEWLQNGDFNVHEGYHPKRGRLVRERQDAYNRIKEINDGDQDQLLDAIDEFEMKGLMIRQLDRRQDIKEGKFILPDENNNGL